MRSHRANRFCVDGQTMLRTVVGKFTRLGCWNGRCRLYRNSTLRHMQLGWGRSTRRTFHEALKRRIVRVDQQVYTSPTQTHVGLIDTFHRSPPVLCSKLCVTLDSGKRATSQPNQRSLPSSTAWPTAGLTLETGATRQLQETAR